MEREKQTPDEEPDPRSDLPRELRPFIDAQGRLKQWPVKQKTQRMAASYLAARFSQARTYNEREVNELLNEWHTFEDWALLRRVLFDWRYLDRESDGSRYWVRTSPPATGQGSSPAATSPA